MLFTFSPSFCFGGYQDCLLQLVIVPLIIYCLIHLLNWSRPSLPLLKLWYQIFMIHLHHFILHIQLLLPVFYFLLPIVGELPLMGSYTSAPTTVDYLSTSFSTLEHEMFMGYSFKLKIIVSFTLKFSAAHSVCTNIHQYQTWYHLKAITHPWL